MTNIQKHREKMRRLVNYGAIAWMAVLVMHVVLALVREYDGSYH